jgi:L-ascorbate metabolism protein UlaG (beta-lactamase superfamily)
MSFCQVTLSANAGVSLELGPARVWVDALHDRRVPEFSTLTPELLEQLWANPHFCAPDLIFCTHLHPDHYAPELLAEARRRWPSALTALPSPEGGLFLTGERQQVCCAGLVLTFQRLTHEGSEYADVAHYGCRIDDGGFRTLIAGDCALCNPKLAELADGGVELAILNFPWVTLPRGRAFVERFLHPHHLVVCHLPFARDDRWGYRRAALRAAAQLPEGCDVRVLLEPFQTETIC